MAFYADTNEPIMSVQGEKMSNGYQIWTDNEGFFHRLDGPAIIVRDLHSDWYYIHGVLYRDLHAWARMAAERGEDAGDFLAQVLARRVRDQL